MGDKNCCTNNKIIELNNDISIASKHVPIYTINGTDMIVKISKEKHPMIRKHYIMFVAQIVNNNINIVTLKPGDEPQVIFKYIPGSKLYSYCNIHGLWETLVE